MELKKQELDFDYDRAGPGIVSGNGSGQQEEALNLELATLRGLIQHTPQEAKNSEVPQSVINTFFDSSFSILNGH
ncbi:hypothetical protein [Pelagicoccus albus]|uniref:Uncharacterized protein n=1 Tax=Pelagicoccus albus TaxID=415222 RepID=A0A7X1EA75_9BACT|nr:hypothetical protein [Pelagicoccus albus]MBC2607968.1 hypothetical protein [Pelagicoccus albus]